MGRQFGHNRPGGGYIPETGAPKTPRLDCPACKFGTLFQTHKTKANPNPSTYRCIDCKKIISINILRLTGKL